MNKETLEEVAGKSATESHPICMVTVDDTTFDTNHHGMIAHFHGFIAGAEWQKEQSDWISVQERLPTEAEINSEECELLFYGSKRGENKQQQGVYQGYFDTQTKVWMFQPANLKPEFQGQFYDIEKFYSQDMWFVTHWILIKLP